MLVALNPASFPQESRSCIVRAFHEFVKQATIPEVESKLYARANMFGVITVLGALQDDQLKNYHPLGVPPPSLYVIELQ